MKITDRKIIYSLSNERPQRHIAEYFQIIKYKNLYHLFYGSENKIKHISSPSINFSNLKPSVVIEDAPGGCFCIIEKSDKLFMLCGVHGSNDEQDETVVPDLVWPDQTRSLLDWKQNRKDRKNGVYLLSSDDGIVWKNESNTPVMNGFVFSDSCKLGEVCYDTSPYVVKYKDEYFYYGRLNSSLDERRLYVRKSNDLLNWTKPEKIKVVNESDNSLKKNYYNPVVIEHNEILYMFAPYFEACGTTKRQCSSGCTVMLCSSDGVSWRIEDSFLHHEGKYKHRVNEILREKEGFFIFYRENVLFDNQYLTSYNINLGGIISEI